MEMYAGHVACCPLVCDVEYTPHVLLRLGKNGGKWTDGRTPDCYIMLCIRSDQCIKFKVR